jgi:uncharacterized protein (TIGR00725 family)
VAVSEGGAGSATYVAVVGPGDDATPEEMDIAWQVGRLLADRRATVVCGGLGGVMAAVCDGALSAGGLTVGLLPGRDRATGNEHLSVALPTGLGEQRNGLVVAACDALIAIGGSWGTLSEVALAMRTGKPALVIGEWTIDDPRGWSAGLRHVVSAEQAVDEVLTLAASSQHGDET